MISAADLGSGPLYVPQPGESIHTMKNSNDRPFRWQLSFSELVGTALLVVVGLSLVTVIFGTGSSTVRVVSNEGVRRLNKNRA